MLATDTAVTAASAPQSRRRWLQFSLRTLLLLMLAIGCGLGWLGAASEQVEHIDRGRDGRLSSAAPPSEPYGRFSRIRLSG